MSTTYKEMNPQIAFVIVQNEGIHKRYINGCFNPKIEITYHPDGAKHYDTRELAQAELSELELDKFKPPFIIEEHEWL